MTCRWRASRGVGEERNDYGIGFLDQKAAKLVKPDFFGGVVRWMSKLASELLGYRRGR